MALHNKLGRKKQGRTTMKMFGSKACQFFGTGPVLPVPDVEAAVAYYCSQLGFTLDFVMGKPVNHGSVTRDRVGIQFTRAAVPFSPSDYPGWFYFFIENIDLLASEYTGRGITFTRQLETKTHGMREFELLDLNGFRLRFGQYA